MNKNSKTSKKMLVIIVVAIVSFTVAAIALQFHNGIELSSTLITCWFGFWTVEILALAGIKTSKVKNGVAAFVDPEPEITEENATDQCEEVTDDEVDTEQQSL